MSFCCNGCLMVFSMLMEATDSPDPSTFKKSQLYRRCMAAGIIPTDDSQLVQVDTSDERLALATPSAMSDCELLSLQLKIEGMWCPACSWVIQAALDRLGGVRDVICDFATDRLRCRYDPTRIDPKALINAIQTLGYRAFEAQATGKASLWSAGFVRLIVSALLSANVMMLSWSLYSGFFASLTVQGIRYISWPMAIMASVVLVVGGGPLFRKAWSGVRSGAPGMEALVCFGAASAYFYSLFNFWKGSWHLYFDTASMLITLVLLGKQLEIRAKARVRRDLEGFLELQPNKVRLCTKQFPNGRFVTLDQLTEGGQFRVHAEEIIPADGVVLSGSGLVDESALTGESRPRVVAPNQSLSSGCRLIKGNVTAMAKRVGKETLVGQMIAVIESGLSRRTLLESRTDRWLAWFVPLMITVAVITVLVGHGMGLVWEDAFVRGLTVLVVACPCALGIAIPLARIAGMSCASRLGILVRDFEAFERINQINEVVMDKTGTLTHGRWALEELTVYGKIRKREVLALAAGLEQDVDHAVARAILAHTSERGIAPMSVVRDIGVSETGVSGVYKGHKIKIGSWDFMGRKASPEPGLPTAQTLFSQVFLSIDDDICARFSFGDKLRESSYRLIRKLKKKSFGLHLISGDSQDISDRVGQQVGIEKIHGGLLPKEKADYVNRLQVQGRHVAMIGDGINDAPALARADLSVAVHRSASLAQQASNVTLMRGDPGQFIAFWNLARQVNAKVVQNLGCAWVYNIISIPIAMSGLLNPLIAAIAMLLSSLTVIGNTLLLMRIEPTP